MWSRNIDLSTHDGGRVKRTDTPAYLPIPRDHQKFFLWTSRIWVGRRKEAILGYVPKNDEKKNLVYKGLSTLIPPSQPNLGLAHP